MNMIRSLSGMTTSSVFADAILKVKVKVKEKEKANFAVSVKEKEKDAKVKASLGRAMVKALCFLVKESTETI